MTVDANDCPLVVTYWRSQHSQMPQYRLVWHDGRQWQTSQVGNRTLGFRLSRGGTKRIPISRPLVVAGAGNIISAIFRDEERKNGVSVAMAEDANHANWRIVEATSPTDGARIYFSR